MEPFLVRYSPQLYAVLRMVSGLLFAMHGSQKLVGFPGDSTPVPLGSLVGMAGVLELTLGLLIAVGLFTSYAAFLASGEMAVAYFLAHAPKGPLPILNGGELAVLYCFLFLYMSAFGAGVWSVEAAMSRGRTVANPFA